MFQRDYWLIRYFLTDGDAQHGLVYHSPYLPKPLHISLADPEGEDDRKLFSHYLWNASLLLAEFIEAGTVLRAQQREGGQASSLSQTQPPPLLTSQLGPPDLTTFDITGLSTIELGAGTALPSLLAGLLGAERVVLTDYPAPAVISNLRANAERNLRPELSPGGKVADTVEVDGHAWGELPSAPSSSSSSLLTEKEKENGGGEDRIHGRHHAFDRILVCDCLWMPWQHDNLLKSIDWFLKEENAEEARCWVVAGFHTGRDGMREFFREERLGKAGLEVERIWERDCDGAEREWSWDRGIEDPGARKRWLCFAILKRRSSGGGVKVEG